MQKITADFQFGVHGHVQKIIIYYSYYGVDHSVKCSRLCSWRTQ